MSLDVLHRYEKNIDAAAAGGDFDGTLPFLYEVLFDSLHSICSFNISLPLAYSLFIKCAL